MKDVSSRLSALTIWPLFVRAIIVYDDVITLLQIGAQNDGNGIYYLQLLELWLTLAGSQQNLTHSNEINVVRNSDPECVSLTICTSIL